jgi:hypothetical protein
MIYRDTKRKLEDYELQKYHKIAAKKKADAPAAAAEKATHS